MIVYFAIMLRNRNTNTGFSESTVPKIIFMIKRVLNNNNFIKIIIISLN